ncbi:acyltransferase [uncultured Desulfuromusa sp.]|uniref:acyltransferase n=1 Tax=uncultured Desulfuromusa sp. TaxID=219183 RepID=UPI002AA8F8C9|nr:acyltransferase [uncultured Desulfuromusa sp.]
MWKSLKLLKWNLQDKYGRLLYYQYFTRDLPGTFGERVRMKLLSKYFESCGDLVIIYQGVRFRGIHKLNVGSGVHIGVDNFIQASGGVTLGDDVMLGPGVKIWSVNHKSDRLDIPISQQGYDYKSVHIGSGTWLGANVFVMPGVDIPEGCIVSAGSVVGIKKYPPYSILAGNPCRVIGTRKPDTKK